MKFRLYLLLIAVGILGMALAVISPSIRFLSGLSTSIHKAQQVVINDLDHYEIRNAGLQLIMKNGNRDIDLTKLPAAIAKTDPKYVHVHEGVLYIEYGGGFAHFGLIIDRNVTTRRDARKLTEGVFYYESEE